MRKRKKEQIECRKREGNDKRQNVNEDENETKE